MEKDLRHRDENIGLGEFINSLNENKWADDKLPPCWVYQQFLIQVCSRTAMDIEQARKKYGLYTFKQWVELLNSLGCDLKNIKKS